MMTLAALAGIWMTTCIQTQMNGDQGYTRESYEFTETGKFEFTRAWFKDAQCLESDGVQGERGVVQLGEKIKGSIFNPEAFEADFTTGLGKDLGAVSVTDGKLKIARGTVGSSFRNTMLSLFPYEKGVRHLLVE